MLSHNKKITTTRSRETFGVGVQVTTWGHFGTLCAPAAEGLFVQRPPIWPAHDRGHQGPAGWLDGYILKSNKKLKFQAQRWGTQASRDGKVSFFLCILDSREGFFVWLPTRRASFPQSDTVAKVNSFVQVTLVLPLVSKIKRRHYKQRSHGFLC